MGMILKAQGEKVTALCLLLVCFFTMVFSQTVYAVPDSNTVTLAVEQTFTKPASSSAANAFTYKLTAKETGNPMPSGSSGSVYTFTISGTGSVNIFSISFTQTGIYDYEIEQYVASPQTGYTYDAQVYTIAVYIDPALQADVIIKKQDGKKTESIVFENNYVCLASDPSLMVDPPVNKTISGSPGKDGAFTFKLEAKEPSYPMPSGSSGGVKTLTIIGSGTEDFGTWSYIEAGTYYYTISEVNNGESGYTYDATVYSITDSVKDADGQLVLTRTVTNSSGKQVSVCAFINQYSATGGIADEPRTGDDAMTGLYQVMLGISGFLQMACIVYLLMGRRRKKK